MPRIDQRRRRVVMDEALQQNEPPALERDQVEEPSHFEAESERANYAAGGKRRGQFRTTDFIPKRWTALSIVVLGLILFVGSLNGFHWLSHAWPSPIVEKFRLSGTGNVSSWFSSLILIISGFASLQIYALRQHRRNDYKGTYRIWLLFAGILLLASLNCVVGLDDLLYRFRAGPPSPWLIWGVTFLKLAAIAAIFVRGLIEVRMSRGTLVLVSMVWIVYALSIVINVPEIQQKFVREPELINGNTSLFAHSLLLVTLLTYARFVFLTSSGLLAMPVPKPKSKKGTRKKLRSPASAIDPSNSPVKAKKKRVAKSSEEFSEELDEGSTVDEVNEKRESAQLRVSEKAHNQKTVEPTRTLELATRTEPKKPQSAGPLSSRIKPASHSNNLPEEEQSDDDVNDSSLKHLSKSERRKLRKQAQQTRRAA